LSIDKYFTSYALRTVGSSSSVRPVTLLEIENRRSATAKLGPLVTVIMTAYRAEATVRFAVESVLAQSYSNLELIVVEDGGGDGTFDLLRGLALEDPRLLAIANEENIGTYRSKNRALKCAKGEFITFHDSDDWWHPDHVMEHMKYMSEHRGLMASTSKWARIDDRGFFQLARSGLFLHLNPASMFVCRKVVSEIGGFDASTTGADSEYVQRIRTVFGTRSIGMISKPLALGLHRPDSLTQSGEGAYDENRYSAVREAYRARWLDWQRQAANTSERLYISLEETSSRFLN
jgi:glycosyltransferase involved in cell wall biosynthesis